MSKVMKVNGGDSWKLCGCRSRLIDGVEKRKLVTYFKVLIVSF